MKRKIISFLFTLGLLLQFSACDLPPAPGEGGDSVANGQWLVYNETQCADPWGYCNAEPDKKKCVSEFVKKQGFTVQEITISQEGPEAVCLACTCPSGRIIKVKVAQQGVEKLLALGFKKI